MVALIGSGVGGAMGGAVGSLILSACNWPVLPVTAAVACGIQGVANGCLETRINKFFSIILSIYVASVIATYLEYAITVQECFLCGLVGEVAIAVAIFVVVGAGAVLLRQGRLP